ncbi:MAG: PAS domain-containing protein [Alphaproteobacteria bacterium]|nr:PAS domain-containing protein [Alphaproteobacteria bacterium]
MRIPDYAHPAVKELHTYWQSLAPEGKLPSRQHIDPVDIAPLLPNIWLLEVHREPLRFWRRLVGTRIEEYSGRNLTRGWIHDKVHDKVEEAKLLNVSKSLIDVVETKMPNWRRGKPNISEHADYAELERLYLPLASDSETVDMILAITVFFKKPEPGNRDAGYFPAHQTQDCENTRDL